MSLAHRNGMTRLLLAVLFAFCGLLGGGPPVWAQGVERATGLSVLVGVTDDSVATGSTVGGSVHVDLTPIIGVEGTGRWLDRGADASAFAADLVGLLGTRLSERMMPYVAAGVGVYRASFDVPTGSAGPPQTVPGFYARRFTATPIGRGSRNVSFTDPSLILGTGVSFMPSRSWVLRPDVRMLFVRRDGDTHKVLVATVNVGFRFEHRPVTP